MGGGCYGGGGGGWANLELFALIKRQLCEAEAPKIGAMVFQRGGLGGRGSIPGILYHYNGRPIGPMRCRRKGSDVSRKGNKSAYVECLWCRGTAQQWRDVERFQMTSPVIAHNTTDAEVSTSPHLQHNPVSLGSAVSARTSQAPQ